MEGGIKQRERETENIVKNNETIAEIKKERNWSEWRRVASITPVWAKPLCFFQLSTRMNLTWREGNAI